MEKYVMIDNKLEELFNTIESSSEYKKYKEIEEYLNKDKAICDLIDEIKKLQQESVKLEYNNDDRYKDIDKEIEEKVKILNSNPVYVEYLNRMNEFNDVIAMSNNIIENYVKDIV